MGIGRCSRGGRWGRGSSVGGGGGLASLEGALKRGLRCRRWRRRRRRRRREGGRASSAAGRGGGGRRQAVEDVVGGHVRVGLFGLARGRDTREKRRANYGPWIWIAAAGIEHGPARSRQCMGLLRSRIPPYGCLKKILRTFSARCRGYEVVI